MKSKRRVYWLSTSITPWQQQRALDLSHKNYDVHFCRSLNQLMSALQTQRAGIIVLCDEDRRLDERLFTSLMSLPEVQGARLILTASLPSQHLSFLVACANFRDIIPIDLDSTQWMARFIFATAARPLDFTPPTGQVSLNAISAVNLPARITWISHNQLRLESRCRPPMGATLNLSGAFAKALGLESLMLTVVGTQRHHLMYRFSDAIIASWSVPTSAKPNAAAALALLQQDNPGPRCRVFVAAQDSALRNALLLRFDDPRFEVATALQKNGIIDEPRFFSPDVVFIEDTLCVEENGARFDGMMASLSETTSVVIIGKLSDAHALKEKYPRHRLFMFSKLPKNISESVLSRHLPAIRWRDDGGDANTCHITAENPFSFAEIGLPARLQQIHPLGVQVALPVMIGNFALLRLDSPLLHRLLGRSPFIKLTATYQDTHPNAGQFTHLADGYLADLDHQERQTLAAGITTLLTEQMTTFISNKAGENIPSTPASLERLAPAAAATVQPGPTIEPLSAPEILLDPKAVPLNAPQPWAPNAGEKPAVQPAPPVSAKSDKKANAPQPLFGKFFIDLWHGLTSSTFRSFVKHVLVIGLLAALFWRLIIAVEPYWTKGGKAYTESLKKFAPHLRKPEEP